MSEGYRRSMGIARSNPAVEPIPRPEELDDFVGKWVAIKDGHVVAVAESSRALVYEVHKLGDRGRGAVVQFVAPPSSSFMVGAG